MKMPSSSEEERNDEALPNSPGVWAKFKLLLSSAVSGKSLAAFRVAIGLVMCLEAYSLVAPSDIIMGRTPLNTYYTGSEIKFNLPYAGFEWLPLLPPQGFDILVGVLAVAGLMMALGLWYRVAAATVFLTFGYFFTVESTRTYSQSYYYIELLFTFLMVWLPAARCYSLDAWRRPDSRAGMVPFWTIFLLRGQLAITYFYAGVAKLNRDWMLDAAPLRWHLREPHVIGRWQAHLNPGQLEAARALLQSPKLAYFLSYAGVAFDLSIGCLLLVRRTRVFGIILMLMFHAINHFVIYDNIDWFPLVGVATALIFLEPDWPERFWNWLNQPKLNKPDLGWLLGGALLFPVVGAALGWKFRASETDKKQVNYFKIGYYVIPLVLLWLFSQAFFPIRGHFIAGDDRITREGLSFSWRLKADDHFALPVQISIEDSKIISRNGQNGSEIDWNEWRREKVIYRRITPGKINWTQLPELVVLLEPFIGERVLYNTFSAPGSIRTEAEVHEAHQSDLAGAFRSPAKDHAPHGATFDSARFDRSGIARRRSRTRRNANGCL